MSKECIDKLLERTKRKGRGKALKTLLAEQEAKKQCDASHKPKPNDSSSDEDSPRRIGNTNSNQWAK